MLAGVRGPLVGAVWGVPHLPRPQRQLRGASPAHPPPYLKDVLVIFRVQHSRDGCQGNARLNLHGHQRICELEADGGFSWAHLNVGDEVLRHPESGPGGHTESSWVAGDSQGQLSTATSLLAAPRPCHSGGKGVASGAMKLRL